jgi:probable HAF family extracellular repeat protein
MQARSIVISVLLLFLFVSVGVALTFVFFTDVIATPTAQETDTYGMNDKGVIAGDYVDSNGVQHGMILTSLATLVPKLTTADRADCVTSPGSTTIAFYSINNLGVAAGWCTNTDSVQIGFTYSNGTFTDISIPGATLVDAIGINDAGDVVGTYKDANGLQHGYLLSGGKLTNLDPPGTASTNTAWGINNSGVITVYGIDANGKYISFTTADQGQTYTPFQDPDEGTIGTAIHQVNNNGDIVGTYFDANNATHGVLYHAGTYNSFDDPNGVGTTRGDGLNNSLVFVGRYGSGVYGGMGYQGVGKP